MDDFTLRHLDTWLECHILIEDQDRLRVAMIAVVTEDPDLLNKGWSRVRDIAESR